MICSHTAYMCSIRIIFHLFLRQFFSFQDAPQIKTHKYAYTCTQSNVYPCAHTCTHTNIHTHTMQCICTHTELMLIYKHTHTHADKYTHRYTYTHTYHSQIHMYTHLYINTHIYLHIYSYTPFYPLGMILFLNCWKLTILDQ